MRYAGHAGVVGLALLTLGAGIVHRSRNAGASPLASPVRTDRNAAAPAPIDPELLPAQETTAGKAVQLWDCRRKLTAEIRTLNGRGVPLSPEELLGIRQQEGKLSRYTQDFRYQLSRDAFSWPQIVNLLGQTPDPEASLQVMEAVRDLLSPAAAGDVALLLSSGATAGVRRLALEALAFQDSGVVLSALARMASEDPQAALRKEALQALAQRKNHPLADDGRDLVEGTLRRQSAADPDPGARDCARSLLEAAPPSSRPVRPARSNRGALGWGS